MPRDDDWEQGTPDERGRQAALIAESIAHDVGERVNEDIELAGTNGNTFEILWNGKPSGKLQIFIPRGTFEPGRVKFALSAPRAPASRTYAKMSTLVTKIATLCRPLSEHELERAELSARRKELIDQIDAIESGTGSIGRYLHVHRLSLATWLAELPDEAIPTGLRFLADRIRDQVNEAAQLRAELAELE